MKERTGREKRAKKGKEQARKARKLHGYSIFSFEGPLSARHQHRQGLDAQVSRPKDKLVNSLCRYVFFLRVLSTVSKQSRTPVSSDKEGKTRRYYRPVSFQFAVFSLLLQIFTKKLTRGLH